MSTRESAVVVAPDVSMQTTEPGSIDSQVKLYTLLVDQLHRYNSVIWQAPTALLAANVLAFDRLKTQPIFILGVAFLNAAVIYAFFKMITQQARIIVAAKSAEGALRKIFPAYLPQFPSKSRVPAPRLMLGSLVLLDLALLWWALLNVSWAMLGEALR